MIRAYAKKLNTLVLLAVIASTNVAATEIFQWVDENGVQHFTQYPPDSEVQGVSKQTLVEAGPRGEGPVEDVFNVEAHEKHMAEWREERDKKRKEARERNDYATQQPPKYQQRNYDYSRSLWYPPIYNRPPQRPPYRPPNRPPVNPERPIFNPRPPTTSIPRGGIR